MKTILIENQKYDCHEVALTTPTGGKGKSLFCHRTRQTKPLFDIPKYTKKFINNKLKGIKKGRIKARQNKLGFTLSLCSLHGIANSPYIRTIDKLDRQLPDDISRKEYVQVIFERFSFQ